MGPCWASLRSTPSRHGRWQRTHPSGPRRRSSSPPLLHPPKSQPRIKPRRLRPDYHSLNSLSVRPSRVGSGGGGGDACEASAPGLSHRICHPAACSHSRRPVITPLKPTALGTKAAMRKGAAVGAGPAPDRQPSLDPRLPGATPLPAPPRRVGLRTLGPATVLRRRGLGLGTVGAGSAAGSGLDRGPATRV